jgi:hypothetical protein
LLSGRQSGSRIGQAGPSLDLNDREKTVLLGDHVDLTCPGSQSTRQDDPPFSLKGQLRGLLGRTTSAIRLPPSPGTIPPGEIVRQRRH